MKKILFEVLRDIFCGLSWFGIGLMFCFISADLFGLGMVPSSSFYNPRLALLDPMHVAVGIGFVALVFTIFEFVFRRLSRR